MRALTCGVIALLSTLACGSEEPTSDTSTGGACTGANCAAGGSATAGSSTGGSSTGGSAGAGGGPTGGSSQGGSGGEPWTGISPTDPISLLFIGNSFTHQGPVPHIVRDIATSIGWPTPDVEFSAPGGTNLTFHSTHPETLALVDQGGWDVVVVQDFSTRPTDNAGDPAAFKADATWFYDRIKQSSPDAQVILYETWARHPDHSIYPGTFVDPPEMQAQLRFHYNDAADSYIPANAMVGPGDDVIVAPVGDAWEYHLGQAGALTLHAADLYHAGPTGQYLNGLVIYSTIYGVVADGAAPIGVSVSDADLLQDAADMTTGVTLQPPPFTQPPFAVGQSVQLDFGTLGTAATGWNTIEDCATGTWLDLLDATGNATGVDVTIIDAFTGSNESGLTTNTLGYPGEVSQDVCWTGSFDGHAAALGLKGTVTLSDIDDGQYELVLFASRTGDDGGLGRLTRYTVGGQSMDLEVSNNTSNVATFTGVTPNTAGNITIDVEVSPAGTARFGYLGALLLTKTGS